MASTEDAALLEAERRKRVELAASLLPRNFFDQSGALAKLADSPRITILFEYIVGREPKHMAEQINLVLAFLGWPASRRRVAEDVIPDGVTISPGSEPPTSSVVETHESWLRDMEIFKQQKSTAIHAAEALRDSLVKCGIDATVGSEGHGLPPDTLLISVGIKPKHAMEAPSMNWARHTLRPFMGSNRQ